MESYIGNGGDEARIVLGETESTAYRGDRGKTAYDHSQEVGSNPHNVVIPAATTDDAGLMVADQFDSLAALNDTLNMDAGVYTAPSVTDLGTGSVTIGSGEYMLYANTTFAGLIAKHTIAGDTFELIDQYVNYIVADYSSGTPEIKKSITLSEINDSSIVSILTIYRDGTDLHILSWGETAKGAPVIANRRVRQLRRFENLSGLVISEIATRVVNVTAGVVWYGNIPFDLLESQSNTDTCTLHYHDSGVWTSADVTQYDNFYYDDGTDKVELTPNRYAIAWVYIWVATHKHICMTLGDGNYTLSQAQDAQPPAPPQMITSMATFVGRIIVKKSAATATEIDGWKNNLFTTSSVTSHADLLDLDYANAGHTGFAPENVAGLSGVLADDQHVIASEVQDVAIAMIMALN